MMFTDFRELLITLQLWQNVKQNVSTTTRVLLLTGSQASLENPVGI